MKTLAKLISLLFVLSMFACGPAPEQQDAEEPVKDDPIEEEATQERDALIEEHKEEKEEPVYELQREEAPPKE